MGKKLLNLIDKLNTENSIFIDTPFLIYHLEDVKPYSDVTSGILDSIAAKKSRIYLSLISFTEMLVGILKQDNQFAERNFKSFFNSNPFIDIVDFKFELTEPAACIRVETGLGLADSIVVATAMNRSVRFLITNDYKFKELKNIDFEVMMLDELVD